MTNEGLIRKAREHLRAIEQPNSFGAPSDAYDETRVLQTTLIYFGSQKRSASQVHADMLPRRAQPEAKCGATKV